MLLNDVNEFTFIEKYELYKNIDFVCLVEGSPCCGRPDPESLALPRRCCINNKNRNSKYQNDFLS